MPFPGGKRLTGNNHQNYAMSSKMLISSLWERETTKKPQQPTQKCFSEMEDSENENCFLFQ